MSVIVARTVEGYLRSLLKEHINITQPIRSQAATSQDHLRDFLADEFRRDSCFPKVLHNQDRIFIGGSFERESKLRPLDDIDIYVPLDGLQLVYLYGYGHQLPFTVLSDQQLAANPLLQDPSRWMSGESICSEKLIDGFATILHRHYPNTTVRPDGQAVNLQMTIGATKESPGLGFDVVPCFSLRPNFSPALPFYLIPDGFGNWIRTNPRRDSEISLLLHRNSKETFRKAVKLLKWWNVQHFGNKLTSYFVELAIMRAFYNYYESFRIPTTVATATERAFHAVYHAVSAGTLESWIPDAPAVERGPASPTELALWDSAAGKASQALRLQHVGNETGAIEYWTTLFAGSTC